MAEIRTKKRVHPAHFAELLPGRGLRIVGPNEEGETVIGSTPTTEDENGPQSVTQAELEETVAAYTYDEKRVKDEDKALRAEDEKRVKDRETHRASGRAKLKNLGLTDAEIDALRS